MSDQDAPIDDEDVSEQLDDDKLPAEYPPDEPMGVDEYGITRAEARVDEPLEELIMRERPDDRGAEEVAVDEEGS